MRSVTLIACIVLGLSLCNAVQAKPPTDKHDRDIIRFFVNHPKLAVTTAGQKELWRVLGRVSDRLRSLQAARKAKAAQPAHMPLWLCIHAGEGSWTAATGNGYYGGLQMTYGWAGLIPGRASDLTPLQQMQAAERGYAASGYSLRWLRGQWPVTSRRCI